jgi:ribosomal subunit interface protein
MVVLLLPVVSALRVLHATAPSPRAAAAMALRFTGSNVEITEALKEHAQAKLAVPLDKFASVLNDAQDVDLHLKVEKRGVHDEVHAGRASHFAEVTAHLKGPHKTVTVHAETEDMYSSIDQLEAMLARKLRKAKERQADLKVERGVKGKSDMEQDALGDMDDEE